MEELGFVSMPSGIRDKLYSGRKQGVNSLIDDIEIAKDCASCEIVMLQPARFTDEEIAKVRKYDLKTVNQITFADVVSCLTKLKSPFADIFARYVAVWAPRHDGDKSYYAGARPPKKIVEELDALRARQ